MQRLRSFPPLSCAESRVLVLGSMPGAASLAAQQYYAHRHNAFWPIMCDLFDIDPTQPYDARCRSLLRAGVAVWDVLEQCRRVGSLDADIEKGSIVANDFRGFFDTYPRIGTVFFNGATAQNLFRRHVARGLSDATLRALQQVRLPSTSPAHAAMTRSQKAAAWAAVREALEQPLAGDDA
ncbi:MAG: DNA-deoxyinosine glycosylase [Gammaproteobacteria bacterium]|nr:DNA-deoxyinosine glycosylase [Gammaproteobacteria bacterium]